MKINRTGLFLSTIGTVLLSALYPLIKILIQIKNIQNLYFSFGVIFYLLLLVLTVVLDIVIIIYFIIYVIKNDVKLKPLWILLILVLNIFIIPFFYMKYVEKEKHIVIYTILYLLPILIYFCSFGLGMFVFNDLNTKKLAKEKEIEETRNYYTTKDEKTTFTFRYGYKKEDVGEYDLYVINRDKGIVFSAFTYNLIDYEQRSIDDYINKGIEDIKVDKKNFLEYGEREVIKAGNASITTVSYQGQAEVKTKNKVTTSSCIYKLSTITFDDDPNYLVYVIEVVTKASYDDNKDELIDILRSVSLKN